MRKRAFVLTRDGVGVLVRVLGDEGVLDVSPPHAVRAEQHQRPTREGCRQAESVRSVTVGRRRAGTLGSFAILTWQFYYFFVRDQIQLVKHSVMLCQVLVFVLFLLTAKD